MNETLAPPAIPIHKRYSKTSKAVNPQIASFLFNGRVPPEIRDSIFDYALCEQPKKTNLFSRRPGKKIDIALLLTCRRVYLEAYHRPFANKEFLFVHVSGNHQERRVFDRLLSWQLELVKEIHLVTQMYWLDGSFPHMSRDNYYHHVERLIITVRRGDWWYNESNAPLTIRPQGRFKIDESRQIIDRSQIERDYAAQDAGESVPFAEHSWGCAFSNLPALKELIIELETTEDKKDELIAIVNHAKKWRFPHKDGAVLSTEGLAEKWSSSRGPKEYWSNFCPYCSVRSTLTCKTANPPNEKCLERMRLRDAGLGPIAHVAKLKWKVVNGGGR